jgi:hypothetical protein
MRYEFRAGDQVIVKGEVFTVLSKRMGLDFYEIGKPHHCGGQQFYTCVRNGLYASDMKLVTEATIENAQDIEREMEATRGEED